MRVVSCLIRRTNMSTQIQFGDKWVQVKGSIFYLTPSAMESLRAWYDWSVNHDTEASEESRAEEVEYFAKAFEMLKPQSHDEAFHYLTILENAFVKNWLIINEYKKKSINVRKDPAPFLNLIVSSCY